MQRKSYKIREPVASRFESYKREGESQTEALDRLMDDAGLLDVERCVMCDDIVSEFVQLEDTLRCLECAADLDRV